MRVFLKDNVYDKALQRIRWVFDEFPTVIVNQSGGKDSTVILELAMIVARDLGRLPLKVRWLDQECEFDATVAYMTTVMERDDVEPLWYQIPFRLLNATSGTARWLNVWGPGEQWVREKHPLSIKENVYDCDRFARLFDAITKHDHPNDKVAVLTGVRAEESPGRFKGLTSHATYKWATWGSKVTPNQHIIFHPLYDWSYIDVWKSIHDHDWEYNEHYDHMYQYGVPIRNMRVSNYHHETSIHALFYLQEIEPDTYQAAVNRISGLDTAGKLGRRSFFPKELPYMFTSWRDYRDHLLENLIEDPALKAWLAKEFTTMETVYPHEVGDGMWRVQVQSILTNDVDGTLLKNWKASGKWSIHRLREKGLA